MPFINRPYEIDIFETTAESVIFGGEMPYTIRLWHNNGKNAYGNGFTLQEAIDDALSQIT